MTTENEDLSSGASIDEIRRFPVLTNEENLKTFELLWAGDEGVRESLVNGNMHWVLRLVEEMVNDTDITMPEIIAAGRLGLADAVNNFTNAAFDFAPNESLQNGYAIWWVRLRIAKLAQEREAEYLAASNAMSKLTADK